MDTNSGHNYIMQLRPEGFYLHIIAGRMDAVGQQYHYNPAFKVHPERSPGETEMPHTLF